MKEVTVKAWCDDLFQVHENRTEATSESTVTVEHKRIVLDTCDYCAHQIAMLMDRIEEIGTPAKPKQAAPRKRKPRSDAKNDGTPASYRTCPECGEEKTNRSALGTHVHAKHGKKLSDWEWDYDPRAAREAARQEADPSAA